MKRPQLCYKATVQDYRGEVLSQEEKKSRSFLGLWNKMIYTQMRNALSGQGSFTVTDINGAGYALGAGNGGGNNFMMNAGVHVTTNGIVIGTSNTPVAVADFRMGALIAQGFSAGQMDYMAQIINASVVADPNCDFFMSRQMANNSGGLITVRESGIYATMDRSMSPFSTAQGCVVRDVFAVPQDVPDGGGITIEYTLRVTE